MNKKGFVFIETLISITVLATALVLLYSSFTNTLRKEKERLYYDDVAFIYRTLNIKEELNNIDFDLEDNDYLLIDSNSSIIKDNINNNLITNMFNDYNVKNILLCNIDNLNKIDDIKIDSEFKKYLKTISLKDNPNIMVIEYNVCNNKCQNYYSWVRV